MIGIIILNYNTWKETEECVNSIRKHNTSPYKIYIVDNCSRDDSVSRLKELYRLAEDVEVIENDRNTGYSAGNNIGIHRAEHEGCKQIFIVNSDVELLNDAFTIMTETLEKNPSCMMVGPSVMDNNNNESQIPKHVLTPALFMYERHPLCLVPYFSKKSNRIVQSEVNPTIFEGSVSGCCFGMKTEDFKLVDYFDENVFLYYEEDVLGYKMKTIGKKTVFEKNAKVWHKANVSTNKEGSAFVQFYRWTSVLYMLKTYAHINKMKQIGIAIWNIGTWELMSISSKPHRKMLHDFKKRNWAIVKESN